jgi:hypothetical protein
MLTDDAEIMHENAGDDRLELIVSSFKNLLKHDLVAPNTDAKTALWETNRVVLAHGTQTDPIFFYANKAALDLFNANAADFIRTPSRYSAEPVERAERQRLFDRVQEHNYIDDYAGVRITFPKSERFQRRRFEIRNAIVWNLLDEAGDLHGQAATFDQWEWLDSPNNTSMSD